MNETNLITYKYILSFKDIITIIIEIVIIIIIIKIIIIIIIIEIVKIAFIFLVNVICTGTYLQTFQSSNSIFLIKNNKCTTLIKKYLK